MILILQRFLCRYNFPFSGVMLPVQIRWTTARRSPVTGTPAFLQHHLTALLCASQKANHKSHQWSYQTGLKIQT